MKEDLHVIFSTASTVLQDMAIAADIVGTVITAIGGPMGPEVSAAFANPFETVFSWSSTVATVADDYLMDGSVNTEASAVSFSASVLGGLIPIAPIDLAIDAYVSAAYNHDFLLPKISEIFPRKELESQNKPQPQEQYLPIVVNSKNQNDVYLPFIAK